MPTTNPDKIPLYIDPADGDLSIHSPHPGARSSGHAVVDFEVPAAMRDHPAGSSYPTAKADTVNAATPTWPSPTEQLPGTVAEHNRHAARVVEARNRLHEQLEGLRTAGLTAVAETIRDSLTELDQHTDRVAAAGDDLAMLGQQLVDQVAERDDRLVTMARSVHAAELAATDGPGSITVAPSNTYAMPERIGQAVSRLVDQREQARRTAVALEGEAAREGTRADLLDDRIRSWAIGGTVDKRTASRALARIADAVEALHPRAGA